GACDAVDAIPPGRARRSSNGTSLWRTRPRRWILPAVFACHGVRNVAIWICCVAAVVSSGLPIRGRALGAAGHDRHMVGKFAAGLHVFQSILVARALRIYGRAFFLVLATHARRAKSSPVVGAGADCRTDDQRLLPECAGAD